MSENVIFQIKKTGHGIKLYAGRFRKFIGENHFHWYVTRTLERTLATRSLIWTSVDASSQEKCSGVNPLGKFYRASPIFTDIFLPKRLTRQAALLESKSKSQLGKREKTMPVQSQSQEQETL